MFEKTFSFSSLLFCLLFVLGGISGCHEAENTSSEKDEEEFVTIELAAPKTVPLEETSSETESKNVPGETVSDSELAVEEEVIEITASRAKNQGKNSLRPKNVILMIADGAGFGTFYSAADFMTGSPTGLFYQQAPWKMISVATFHKKSFYNPEKDWADFRNYFVPFYERETAFIPPDSASSGTALNTGVKTRNGRVGMGPDDEKLTTIAEIFHQNGLRTGAVTSFQIASATVAAVAGHDLERKNGQKLFEQLFLGGNLDVLIGASHPEFNDDGEARNTPEFGKYGPSPELWKRIRSGNLPEGWTFIEKHSDFQKYADLFPDCRITEERPKHLLGIAQAANSFQCHRSAEVTMLSGTPTLAEVALAALNILAVNPETGKRSKGFYLMVEGGAIDAANDAHNFARCMEEMSDFNRAVKAVCDWVEHYSSWEETLVLVTADHDNGAIYGPESGSDGVPLTAPIYRGKGTLPDMKYYSDDHTKQLVPLYARGIGAEKMEVFVEGTDARMGKFWLYDGRWIDNTAIFRIIME